jgi:D-alanine-D-alanine ligase
MSVEPQSFGKVAVLMGGLSSEREVSFMSGGAVLESLKKSGVDAYAFDPALRPLSELVSDGVDRVFITLHGRYGEDGTVQGALELMKIPYTGSGHLASALAMDKVQTKRIWQSVGLPSPDFEVVHQGTNWRDLVVRLGLPLIIKPACEGSSIGVSKVKTFEELEPAFLEASKYGGEVIAEAFISGSELTVPVLGDGNQAYALPVIRIEAPEANYDYEHKYFSDDTQYHCPSGLAPDLEKKVQEMVVQAYRVLGCSGWGRADLMMRQRDQHCFLLEMNTSPGMTGHSLVPLSAKVSGLNFDALVLKILSEAKLKI